MMPPDDRIFDPSQGPRKTAPYSYIHKMNSLLWLLYTSATSSIVWRVGLMGRALDSRSTGSRV